MSTITKMTGKEKLKAAVEKDANQERDVRSSQEYWNKYNWVLQRAEHYAEKTGLSSEEILNAWEEDRTYWYMNYYQEANQPEIRGDKVRVFETVQAMLDNIGEKKFRCPCCSGVSTNPYVCNSGVLVDKKECSWKVYGFLGDLGKGAYIYIKKELRGETIFMPLAWEEGESK